MATKSDDTATPLADELNPHAAAFLERAKAPMLYDDPSIATPGKLRNLDEIDGPVSLVHSDPDGDIDPSVDNRDEVQALLELNQDGLEASLERQVERAQENIDAGAEGLDANTLPGGANANQVRQAGTVKKADASKTTKAKDA